MILPPHQQVREKHPTVCQNTEPLQIKFLLSQKKKNLEGCSNVKLYVKVENKI